MEVTGQRKLRNEELRNLYSSPNIVRVIKSKGMIWACSTHGLVTYIQDFNRKI